MYSDLIGSDAGHHLHITRHIWWCCAEWHRRADSLRCGKPICEQGRANLRLLHMSQTFCSLFLGMSKCKQWSAPAGVEARVSGRFYQQIVENKAQVIPSLGIINLMYMIHTYTDHLSYILICAFFAFYRSLTPINWTVDTDLLWALMQTYNIYRRVCLCVKTPCHIPVHQHPRGLHESWAVHQLGMSINTHIMHTCKNKNTHTHMHINTIYVCEGLMWTQHWE